MPVLSWRLPLLWMLIIQLFLPHCAVFLTWSIGLSSVLMLMSLLTHLVASRGLWPEAGRLPN